METLTVLFAAALPWAAGCAALAAAGWPGATEPSRRPAGRIATVAGYGYFFGVLILTLWMRLLSATGIAFGRLAIAVPLALVAAIGIYLARERTPVARAIVVLRSIVNPPLPRWQRILWWSLLALMALRFATLAVEVAVRPLYPWDAWTQWATKARVWYESGRMVAFVPASDWLAGPAAAYFDVSPANPATVPLLQAWSAIALGRWDDSATNWPWLLMLGAMALAIYGALRERGVPPLGALTGAYIVASLPLLDTHVALAGYPDLLLAGTYTLSALALARSGSSRDTRDGLIAAVLALACPLIDLSGWVWLATLLPGALVARFPSLGLKILAWGFGAATLTVLVLSGSTPLSSALPWHLEYVSPWRSLADAYLLTDNWHLLWYAAAALTIAGFRLWLRPAFAPLTMIVATALGGLLAAAMFGNDLARWFPEAQVLSRATLQIAPLIVVIGALAWRELALRPALPEATPLSAADTRSVTDA